MIKFDEKNGLFFLESKTVSYVMAVERGKLHHLYFGKRIAEDDIRGLRIYRKRSFSPNIEGADDTFSNDTRLCEFSEFGCGDYRISAIKVNRIGACATDFKYSYYEILKEKPRLKGMPSLRQGETLKIVMVDAVSNLRLILLYTIYDEGAIAKSAEIFNDGASVVTVTKFMSGGLEKDEGSFDAITLYGRHEFERAISRSALINGITAVNSTRGASSHHRNPFFALVGKDTTEDNGEAFGVSLTYSGNFLIEAEVDQLENVRVLAGLNPETTEIILNPAESFCAPEMTVVFSSEGLGGMSRAFHDLFRNYLINPVFANAPRPILINNWESTYFDFNEEKICEIVRSVVGTGIDMMVLDDGWFGERNSDTTALGDWTVNRDKLKHGLSAIIDECKKSGLKFGLWFEPEMVSKESKLYKAHEDYVLKTDGLTDYISRNQLVLDFSKKEVVDFIFSQISAILKEYPYISYIKWDMNRHLTCVPSLSMYHGYVLGVYSLYEKLQNEFPSVLIEGCSGGGGRFDPGILYYSAQIWTSDNTDAYSRSIIQYGTSMCYPLSAISNHVSMTPNHQTGRTVSFKTRGNIASLGQFGYELNPLELKAEERAEIAEQIKNSRAVSDLVLNGDLYRIKNPLADNAFCESIVSKDKTRCYVVYLKCTELGNSKDGIVRLKGLNPNFLYKLSLNGESYYGSTLMNVGVQLFLKGDYDSVAFFAEAKNSSHAKDAVAT